MSAQHLSEILDTLSTSLSGQVAVAFSLTLLGGIAIGRLRRKHHDKETARDESDPPALPKEMLLPVVHQDPDHIAKAEVVAQISDLVLTGDWSAVAAEIAAWEAKLEATPAGTRLHDIAIDTCLAPLQNIIDEAPRNTLADLESAKVAVTQFAERQEADRDNHILAVLAARAHIIIGETCNAEFWPDAERRNAWRQMAHHFLAAETILGRFDAVSCMSPLLAGTSYRLAIGMPDGAARLRPAFEDWIDLDPSDPAIYACHVGTLLSNEQGSFADLLTEAEKAEERTRETLGQGGYALFAVPVLERDESLREHFSAERLAGGLMDLAQSSGTQAEINWAAAQLAKESGFGTVQRRKIMLSAFDALARRHLGVIYPRLWDMPLIEIREKLKGVFESETKPASRSGLEQRPVSTPLPA